MDRKLILDFDRKQKSQKHKSSSDRHPKRHGSHHHGHHKSKHPKLDGREPEPETSEHDLNKYRDRAKERREGINTDFALDPDDFGLSNPVVGDEIDEAERKRQQIEESKYLGGDVEHTHLVKGLDFALLEKVKSDQQKLAATGRDRAERGLAFYQDGCADQDDDSSDEEEFTKEALLAASATTSSKFQLLDIEKLTRKSTEMIPCRTALARRILNVLDEKWPDKSELFLPGRMSYVIPLDGTEDNGVTTILRSKADTSRPSEAN